MLTIELTGLFFHANHGLYKDEKFLGGDFEVNVFISHHPGVTSVDHIWETIDYAVVYELVKEHMKSHKPLLETLAISMAREILTKFSQAEEVKISVKKLHPPIIAFQGAVAVTCTLKKTPDPA